MIQNNQASRWKYWVTRSSVRSFARLACAIHCCTLSLLARSLPRWGVLIYKSVSDLNVTIVQPRNMNIKGKTTFIWSHFLLFVLYAPKTVSLISLYSKKKHWKIQDIKGTVFGYAKQKIKKFDQMKVILPIKFMSLGCTMVTLRSVTLLYINKSYSLARGTNTGPHSTATQRIIIPSNNMELT